MGWSWCGRWSFGATAFLAIIIFSLPSSAETIIKGSARHPFPVLIALDYPYCRAKAWLDALNMAQTRLPDSLRAEFGAHVSDMRLGGLAAAALIYPVETVTPELSLGDEINVFLQDTGAETLEKLPDLHISGAMPLQLALLLELEELLQLTEKNWPEDLREADGKTAALETLASAISGLWLMRTGARPTPEILRAAFKLAPRSLLLAFWDSELSLESDLPQTALRKAAKVEERALVQAKANPREKSVWEYLAARAKLTRGRAHIRLGQNALAENAFSTALDTLTESGITDQTRSAILLARAELRKSRNDFAGMCSDYLLACAAGECAQLVLARRNGHCKPAENTSS